MLVRRGHKVRLIAPEPYSGCAADLGIQFATLSSTADYLRSLRCTHRLATRYGALFLTEFGIPWNVSVYRAIEAMASSATVLVSINSGLIWSDLLAHAHLCLPLVRVAIDPPPSPGRLLVSAPPRSPHVERLAAHLDHPWSRAVKENFGISAGPFQRSRLLRSVLCRVPAVGLWPNWLVSGGRVPPIRGLGFVPPPRARFRSPEAEDIRMPEGKIAAFIAGTLGTTEAWRNWHGSLCVAERCPAVGRSTGVRPAQQC
jgi:hypothetical protein